MKAENVKELNEIKIRNTMNLEVITSEIDVFSAEIEKLTTLKT